jgi:hypothetical protein
LTLMIATHFHGLSGAETTTLIEAPQARSHLTPWQMRGAP